MKITVGSIEFEVSSVPAPVRAAVLADGILKQGLRRAVWEWDAATETGKALVRVAQDGAVPLGNGISFFVPRAGANGVVAKADGPSKKMAERVVEATGAQGMNGLMNGLNRVIGLPAAKLPRDHFAPLDKAASYRVMVNVHFSVLKLTNTARNLSFFLLVSGSALFDHEVTAVLDQAALDAVMADPAVVKKMRAGVVVPPRTRANLGLRSLATAQALTDLQDAVRAAGGPEKATDAQKQEMAGLAAEWQVLRTVEQRLAQAPARA